ncbi:OLC1v1033195C1 [Oldenlandia corymbosa var. corymbosa]|uniref:OLC1v1033195C1 n=1 Tax=Oldenlandia corymbosa var. corymbosa TaxID=529605 RepID=A0AAV1CNG5_OLDCO|nr:OLC1v1033195C1 [Oldenlandia corymbosa var. corymbosa]
MGKVIMFAASLVLLFAIAAAFDMEAIIPSYLNFMGKSQGCEKQLQKQQLDCCQTYLRESSRPVSPSSVSMVVDDDEDHNQGTGPSSWRDAFPRCCDQLEHVTKECRCQAITQAIQQQMQQRGQLQGVEMREMLQNARSLPVLCRIKKSQSCDIQIPTGPSVLDHLY